MIRMSKSGTSIRNSRRRRRRRMSRRSRRSSRSRPAKSRDRCDRRSGKIFHIFGKFGEILHFPIGELSYLPIKSSPLEKFLMFLVGKLLSNKQTYKIRLFMGLLHKTDKFFYKMLTF